MNVASYLARRIAYQGGTGFSAFIVTLSTAATAVSVAVMIIALSFVAGFQDAISKKVFSFWGHIRLLEQDPSLSGMSEEVPAYQNDTIVNILRNHEAVAYADVYASRSAMLKSTETIEGVLLKGIEKNFTRERLAPFLIKGSWINFNDTAFSNQIMISAYTAKQLNCGIGDRILIYFMDAGSEAPRVRPVVVCGIFKTGIEEYDKNFSICDIALIRKLNAWQPNQIGGYEVTLKDYRRDNEISDNLLDQIPVQWYSAPVRDIYPGIFDWLQLQEINKQVILAIMAIVALINLISCLIIMVLERRNMIGILKAVGATDFTVQQIFWHKGAIVAAKGILMGAGIGLGICLLQQYTGFITLDESNYFVRVAPVKIIAWQVMAVMLASWIVSFAVLMIPSLLVKKMSPVNVLRFD